MLRDDWVLAGEMRKYHTDMKGAGEMRKYHTDVKGGRPGNSG